MCLSDPRARRVVTYDSVMRYIPLNGKGTAYIRHITE